MESPQKFTLIATKISLKPSDLVSLPYKSQTRHYLSPFRSRKSNIRSLRLPKLSSSPKTTIEVPIKSKLYIKFLGPSELNKIETLIQNNNKFNIIKRSNIAYIKSSQRKKLEQTEKIRSNQDSPVSILPQNSTTHRRSISLVPKVMVDATFNTDN